MKALGSIPAHCIYQDIRDLLISNQNRRDTWPHMYSLKDYETILRNRLAELELLAIYHMNKLTEKHLELLLKHSTFLR
jgi:hypothetical protein